MVIQMRLVSEFSEVKGDPIMMVKHMRSSFRQASFNNLTVGCPSDDIILLDYDSKGDGSTLRSMIMKIQSANSKTPGKLFHVIGQDWKGRYAINFLKYKEEEATMIADGIITFLVDGYGDLALQFFDLEAVIEKAEWTWNADKGTNINPLSRDLDGLELVDDDYNV